jgi:hypothetical protein
MAAFTSTEGAGFSEIDTTSSCQNVWDLLF